MKEHDRLVLYNLEGGEGKMSGVELYFDKARECFEKYDYEHAVELFIKSYDAGYKRDEIVQIFKECFIAPNDEEFRKNYKQSEAGGMPYDALALDFIPVSNTIFYIYDKEEKDFLGKIDYEGFVSLGEELRFHSLLFTEVWDWRQFASVWKEQVWNRMYAVIGDNARRFYAFYKLPGFGEILKKRITVFQNAEDMERYFEENDEIYLPKGSCGSNGDRYRRLLNDIHEKRIHGMRRKPNPLLTICMPTYGRGRIARDYIRSLQKLEYDAEIEILVSDNGSDINDEGYKEIARISEEDSRITYFRLPENRFYSGNIHNVVKMAKGKFLLLTSDEDRLDLNQFPNLFELLNLCDEVGTISTNYIYSTKEAIHVAAGLPAIGKATEEDYITGLILNKNILKGMDILRLREEVKDNIYVKMYTHCFYAMCACSKGDYLHVPIPLYGDRIRSKEEIDAENEAERSMVNSIPEFLCESRIEQFRALLLVIEKIWKREENDDDFREIFLDGYERLFGKLKKLYLNSPENFEKKLDFGQCCDYYCEKGTELCREFEIKLPWPELLEEIKEVYVKKWSMGRCLNESLCGEEDRK